MRLIDADEIRWAHHYDSDGNLSKYKVAYSDEMPPAVDAIPVDWIEETMQLAETVGAKEYAEHLEVLLDDWAERKDK